MVEPSDVPAHLLLSETVATEHLHFAQFEREWLGWALGFG
jgi:hypothetical protein